MTETGLLEYFERRHPVEDSTCERLEQERMRARTLSLEEVGAPFVILAAGIPTAVTVLILEILIMRFRTMTRRSNK